MQQQITEHILMVRPANFGFNPQTAKNNAFQTNDTSLDINTIKTKAIAEFDQFVNKLRSAGVHIIVAEDTVEPIKMDAVFPNNWITLHENGTVITYPMHAPMRRLERREDIIEQIGTSFQIKKRIHLEGGEADHQFLEGTGSMIFDRQCQIVYACRSVRTSVDLLDQFCTEMDAEKVLFNAVDGNDLPIYHTNVMMALGETFVVICMDSIPDVEERAMLEQKFKATKKEIIPISLEQMLAFAGNMLQVRNRAGEGILVMSQQAYASLEPTQIEQLKRHTQLLHSDIKTIETYGGGSARCMMAEVFLPEK